MCLIHGKIKVIGISRSSEYSPNHVDNDAAILEVVAETLRDKGCEVEIWPEKEFVSKQIRTEFIFNMARDRSTIEYLKQLEDNGSVVVNSAYGIANCMRKSMTELLIRNGFAHPVNLIVPTDGKFTPELFPCWIKRGDSHAMVKEDVVYVECKEEAEQVLADFHSRGISEAVINEHLSGDLVKFYGVQGTDFFFSFYPTDACHSKLGLEIVNGTGSRKHKAIMLSCGYSPVIIDINKVAKPDFLFAVFCFLVNPTNFYSGNISQFLFIHLHPIWMQSYTFSSRIQHDYLSQVFLMG